MNGSWGEWSPFGDCDVTCGGGVEYRIRVFDGDDDDDDENEEETESRICNTLDCLGKTIEYFSFQCKIYFLFTCKIGSTGCDMPISKLR